MNIITLPQYFNIDDTAPIQVFNYHTYQSCLRSKINLSKNVFSFLKTGTKEIITNRESTTIENNEFLIIKSGHCLMTETVSDAQKTYNSILFFFSDEMLLIF